jgi:shikimate dehydrogenase
MEKIPNYKAELVGVFGHPVAENPTIVLQEAAFRELSLNWRYLTIEVHQDDLADAMQGLRAFNMRGVNLTIPHKVAVLPYLDEISSAAELIGAVNTVINVDNHLLGENTDGKGFLRSLVDDAGVNPTGKKVVLLGAGGAARAIAVELALAGAVQITVLNRSAARGRELAALLNSRTPVKAQFTIWDHEYAVPADCDVLVNATSIGLYPDTHAKPSLVYSSVLPSMVVCDVIPNPPNTLFLSEAQGRAARTLDGLGMLVYQGAIGFRLWTGLEAPVAVMRSALEEALGVKLSGR